MFYTDAEKQIYTSPTGTRHDPLALQRKLVVASGGNLNAALVSWSDAKARETDRAAAEEQLVAAARVAFGFKPFDAEGGVVDAVVIETLEHFLRYLEGKGQGDETQPG